MKDMPQTGSAASSSIPDVQWPLPTYLSQQGLILALRSPGLIHFRGLSWWSSYNCPYQLQAFLVPNLNPLKSGLIPQYEEFMLPSNGVVGLDGLGGRILSPALGTSTNFN